VLVTMIDKDRSDTNTDCGTDDEDVELFMSNFVFLFCR
jgi:hypothetical protein